MEDLISVIVPIYNAEKYLNNCIDSIIDQSYQNIEIILVDDGSIDETQKICDSYANLDSRIKVYHKSNGGVSSARNYGLKKAKGKWISFVDSDDWLDKDYFKILHDSISSDVSIVCCGYKRTSGTQVECINSDGKELYFTGTEFIEKLLNVQNGYGFVHTKIYKKELIDGVSFNETLKVAEDALFNMQVSKKANKIKVINKSLYNYRVTGESAVRKFDENYINKYIDGMNACSDFINNYYSDNQIIMTNLKNFVSYHLLLIAVHYCYNPKNQIKDKQKLLKDTCNIELFKNAVENCNYQDLSITRKITLFTLKKKLYFITGLICKIRQMQIKEK